MFERVLQFFPLVLDVDLEEILDQGLCVAGDPGQLGCGVHGKHLEVLLECVRVVGTSVQVRGLLGELHDVVKDYLGREEPLDLLVELTRHPSLAFD